MDPTKSPAEIAQAVIHERIPFAALSIQDLYKLTDAVAKLVVETMEWAAKEAVKEVFTQLELLNGDDEVLTESHKLSDAEATIFEMWGISYVVD